MSQAPPCAAPDFAPRQPQLKVPAGSCDCHAHILGPAARFPYSDERVYTPPDCLLADYRAMLTALGLARAVLVQPSVYGSDNRVLLNALDAMQGAWRGVAVVEPDVSASALQEMHAAGVRGVRVNVVDVQSNKGVLPLKQLRGLAERIAPLGWHMEFLLHVHEFPRLDQQLAGFPVDVVFGHLGYLPTQLGIGDAGFQALLRLLQAGRAWVKLTGPYRLSGSKLPYADVVPFAHALLDAAPRQIVWGSDWPHVMVKGAMPNDGDLMDILSTWIPDPSIRHQVLVSNPERLYGFQSG
ncbi:MAG: amidohydrolase family protein [Hylemonella sp.]